MVSGMETTEQLMPIGRFARLTGLTVKALRHYDEVGLLRPAAVDPDTGYRSYAPDQFDVRRRSASCGASSSRSTTCSRCSRPTTPSWSAASCTTTSTGLRFARRS